MKTFSFIILILPVLFSCTQKNIENSLSLYTYTFSMEKMSIPDQVKLADSLGYKGFTYTAWDPRIIMQLDTFFAQPEVQSGKLHMAGVFWVYDLAKPNDSVWTDLLPVLAEHKVPLWPIFGPSNDPGAKQIVKDKLAAMCDSSARYGIEVVIYPHDGCYIESAEQALPYIKELNKNNLFLSLHLCHEIRAGNGKRIDEVVQNVGKYIRLVSISGADTIPCTDCPDWSDSIKPLYEGDYNTSDVYNILKESGYTGPVILHTYGITEKPLTHLAGSMKVWRSFIENK